MKKTRVLCVFGTRPEAIKMCPLIKLLEKDQELESIVCVTGQHRKMLDNVLNIFNVKPQFDLDVMSVGQTISDVSTKVLSVMDEVIRKCSLDIVLVHDDTSTILNVALAAFYNQKIIGHVEAGLRTGNINSPFPEEANRKLTGAISTLHFTPTTSNVENLAKENIVDNVYITGNTVIDALFSVIDDNYKFENQVLNNIDFQHKKVILLTAHRRENWGEPMKNIFQAIKKLVLDNSDIELIFPMHKNPVVRDLAREIFEDIQEKIHLIEPLEYVDFANAMAKCYLIMTDSGGIQEEAPALGKPVVVLRTETERPEAVLAGTVKIGGVETESIFKIANQLINNEILYNQMAHSINPYGDGHACERIVGIIKDYFKS